MSLDVYSTHLCIDAANIEAAPLLASTELGFQGIKGVQGFYRIARVLYGFSVVIAVVAQGAVVNVSVAVLAAKGVSLFLSHYAAHLWARRAASGCSLGLWVRGHARSR